MKRRDFLKAAAIGPISLAGCGGSGPEPQASDIAPAPPPVANADVTTPAPAPELAPAPPPPAVAGADGERRIGQARLYPPARLISGQTTQLDYSNWSG